MPKFQYRAVTAAGEIVEGEIEAATQAAAVERIQNMGQIPLRAEQAGPAGETDLRLEQVFNWRQRVTQNDIGLLTRELATLLQAGLPLDHALETLRGLVEKPALRTLLQDIHARVQGGAQFSKALEEQGNHFSRLYLNMVRAGETGGALETVLNRLADYLERSAELRSTVVSALIYPAILFVIAALSVFALLMFVVPQFEPLFADMGSALPLATQIVFGMAELLRSYGLLLILLTVLLILGLSHWLRNPRNRQRWDTMLLRLPFFGMLTLKIEIARFARTLATLLGNGVPLLTAIGIVREVLGNSALADDMVAVEDALAQGRGLAQPLREHSRFTPLSIQLVQVGEESGELEQMLLSIADIYDRESGIAIKRGLTIIEPVLILGLGGMIALIIISILAAILGLNELVV